MTQGLKPFGSDTRSVSALTLVYGVVAGISAGLLVVTSGQVGAPVTLFGAPPEGLAPDTMPRLVLVALLCVAGLGIFTTWNDAPEGFARPVRAVFVTCTASFAFAALLVPLGFVIASALTVVCVAVYLGGRHPVGLALSGVAVPVVIYLVFTRGLHIALPQGLAGF
ncbi:tripartite tricarboxylate transporter TctB family protein [Marivita hallyeonensis]|uniref:Tripartite tricarboxylate transporter TctB family protein n=1 Tax=Marivita hallyeonensis TaxID=996342 RepID=A0A1M5N0S3_9RHOB|nr:tripartite tricarboxylate transporter TctB family protein [Marivita hallyeonensis]SHG83002.1 Tripartite tricarboxylate transporter TctB family protein [Marivita hallyeonensis]